MIPVADAHCDFLYCMYRLGYDIQTLTNAQTIHLPYLQEGGVKLQFFAAWVDHALKTPFLQQCVGMIDAYSRMLQANQEAFVPLTRAYDPAADQRIATVLTVEGGEAIEGSLAALRTLKRLGVSAMTLTWNFNNELAGAAVRRGGKGLTQLGREVVAEMERVGIALDVSHLSDQGIDDALSITTRPIFASHSNARQIYGSPRSLQDEHIREIARRGGVIGVNFYNKQLCAREDAAISDIICHILHILNVGGLKSCAIGSDFDGMTHYPLDLKNSSHMQRLAGALLNEGLSEASVRNIAYTNLRDYIQPFAEQTV